MDVVFCGRLAKTKFPDRALISPKTVGSLCAKTSRQSRFLSRRIVASKDVLYRRKVPAIARGALAVALFA